MILAIDPGNIESAFVVIDKDYKPLKFGKTGNRMLVTTLPVIIETYKVKHFAIEMLASYGMPIGETCLETVFWSGRFFDRVACCRSVESLAQIYRKKDVCMNICHDTRAKDKNIIQALVDRFAMNDKNYGKGTKKQPGWFYGFSADIWQAYAVAVTYYDKNKELVHP